MTEIVDHVAPSVKRCTEIGCRAGLHRQRRPRRDARRADQLAV